MQEQWKECPGYPDYQVSSLGRIKSKRQILSYKRGKFPLVCLCNAGKTCVKRIPRLVCLAFNGPPPSDRHVVSHIGSQYDHSAGNLEWVSWAESRYRYYERSGRVEMWRRARELMRKGYSQPEICEELEMSLSSVRRAELGTWLPGAKPIKSKRKTRKLSNEQVDEILKRLLDGEKGSHLAREYGVSSSMISRIKNGSRRTG